MVLKPKVNGEKPKLLVVLGPTAAGKTALSMDLATRISGEIISADSLQVYKYFDVGTAKPTLGERSVVRHHLIDIVHPDQEFNAGRFRESAGSQIDRLHASGKKIIVVGGTYLYVKALLRGLIEGLPADTGIRGGLKELRYIFGIEYLYRKLLSLDPAAASKIHPNDYVRIERALEVYFLTGRKMSELQSLHKFGGNEYEYLKIGISHGRESLRERIEQRVDKMFERGFVDEVENLRKMGYEPTLKPMQSIGYKEVNRYLDGELELVKAIELIKRDTRRFAKRQMTWLRKDEEIKWFDFPRDHEKAVEVAASFLRV